MTHLWESIPCHHALVFMKELLLNCKSSFFFKRCIYFYAHWCKGVGSSEMELQTVMSCHVGADD